MSATLISPCAATKRVDNDDDDVEDIALLALRIPSSSPLNSLEERRDPSLQWDTMRHSSASVFSLCPATTSSLLMSEEEEEEVEEEEEEDEDDDGLYTS